MLWWRVLHILLLMLTASLLSSCAGPYNAVGPDSPFQRGAVFTPPKFNDANDKADLFLIKREEHSLIRSPASSSGTKITFAPNQMLFSSDVPLVITIKSDKPLSNNYEIIASLNGQDVTHQAKRVTPNPKVVLLTFNSTYFQKKLDYTFTVFFRNSSRESWSHAILNEVDCSLLTKGPFYFPKDMSGKYTILSHLEIMSRKNNINPSLVYGLINQESSFNPRAFSPNMAVGLTQMTLRAAQQVDMTGPQWPIYENLESLPFLQGKFLIETGQIHDDMDWRLGPKKSIEGGIAYLRYLTDYWSKYLNSLSNYSSQGKLDREKTMCNLVLASYNLGPSRLKNALNDSYESQQNEWNKIRPYLRAIKTDSFLTSRGHYEKEAPRL